MTRGRWAPLVVILLVTIAGALKMTAARDVPGDFLRYHRGGRLVVTGRVERLYDQEFLDTQAVYAEERAADLAERGEKADDLSEYEFKYLPAVAVLMAPLGALHPRTASILWGAWNAFLISLTFVAAWWFVTRGGGRDAGGGYPRTVWVLLPLAALGHAAYDNLNLGQLNPTAIAAATVSVALLAARRDLWAGVLAGFGGAVKFMPWVLVLWFAWKRRWAALGFLLAGALLFALALPAATLGPSRAWKMTQEWYQVRSTHYTGVKNPDLPGHSIKSFVFRTLGTTPFLKGRGEKQRVVRVSVAQLPNRVLFWLVMGLNVVVLVLVCRFTPGPLRAWGIRGPPEAAAFMASLLLVSPESRGPHFLYLALPAMAATYGLLRLHRSGALTGRALRVWIVLVAVAGVLLWTNSKGVFGRDLSLLLVALCSLGWAAALLLAANLAVRRRTGAPPDPSAAPAG